MTQKQKNIRFILYGFLGLIGIVMIGYFLIVRPMQVRSQKANFDKAEAKIDQLAIEIEKLVGKPDEIKKEKSCDRPNLKFEKGPLSCFIDTNLLYKNKTVHESNELMSSISGLSTMPVRVGSVASLGNSLFVLPSKNGDQTFYQNFSSGTSFSCTLSYIYPAKEHKEFKASDESSFVVGFDCGGPAMKEFFPLKD